MSVFFCETGLCDDVLRIFKFQPLIFVCSSIRVPAHIRPFDITNNRVNDGPDDAIFDLIVCM